MESLPKEHVCLSREFTQHPGGLGQPMVFQTKKKTSNNDNLYWQCQWGNWFGPIISQKCTDSL